MIYKLFYATIFIVVGLKTRWMGLLKVIDFVFSSYRPKSFLTLVPLKIVRVFRGVHMLQFSLK